MADRKVDFELVDDAPLDSGVWKDWKDLVLDMEWPTDDSSVTTLGPIISTTQCFCSELGKLVSNIL